MNQKTGDSLKYFMPIFLLVIISILFNFTVSAQTAGQNYIQTVTPRTGAFQSSDLDTMVIQHKTVNVSYFDGLGRPIQTVNQGGSPSLNDQITINNYDALDRPARLYLPYTDGAQTGNYRADTGLAVISFYSKPPSTNIVTTGYPFSNTRYEASPLDRPVEQGFPGSDWQIGNGHTVTTNYGSNGTTSFPTLFTVNGTTVTATSGYPANSLYVKVVADENGNSTYENYDLQGKLIWKWVDGKSAGALQTYYVYNDLDQLAYVLPPKATNLVGSQNNTFSESASDPLFNENIYAYHYDGRGRVVEKKVPGKDWEYIVYNAINQVVLTQDGNQRGNHVWLYTKYDGQRRKIQTGFIGSNTSTRLQMQALIDGQTNLWEDRTGNASYPGTAYPQAEVSSLSYVTYYYDDYAFTGGSSKPFAANPYNASSSQQTDGLMTGMSVNIMGTAKYLLTVNYYDNLGRLIQTQSDNNLGGANVVSNQLDFVGEITASQRVYTASGTTTTVTNRYVFDNQGRRIGTFEKINSDPEVYVAGNNYNEVGQLIRKSLHQSTATAWAQGIDYRYNERGWLKTINNSALKNDGGATNPDSGDLFGELINYNEVQNLSGWTPQYNGNISGMSWQSKTTGTSLTALGQQGYAYQYDPANRLTGSNYGVAPAKTPGSFTASLGAFNENLSYDDMGNIITHQRYNKTLLNKLTYSYSIGGLPSNKLQSVSDAVPGPKNASGGYSYDANGNQLTDTRQGITIHYNYLNLSDVITKGATQMTNYYDGLGNKIEKVITGPGTYSQRDYIGEVEMTRASATAQSTVDFIHTEEGKAAPVATGSNSFLYQYFMKDHLGNVRVAFQVAADNKTVSIFQVQDYYPFGSDSYGITPSPSQNYKYNGKELQAELSVSSYDYGARWYDPVIGRFTSVDPKAGKFQQWSPFTYTLDNPLKYIDPNGKGPEWIVGTDGNRVTVSYDQNGAVVLSSNAPAAVALLASYVPQSDAARNALVNADQAAYPISFAYSREFKMDQHGSLTLGNTKTTIDKSGTQLSADITLYKGSIDYLTQPAAKVSIPGLPDGISYSQLGKDITTAGVVVHEITHATDAGSQFVRHINSDNFEQNPDFMQNLFYQEMYPGSSFYQPQIDVPQPDSNPGIQFMPPQVPYNDEVPCTDCPVTKSSQ